MQQLAGTPAGASRRCTGLSTFICALRDGRSDRDDWGYCQCGFERRITHVPRGWLILDIEVWVRRAIEIKGVLLGRSGIFGGIPSARILVRLYEFYESMKHEEPCLSRCRCIYEGKERLRADSRVLIFEDRTSTLFRLYSVATQSQWPDGRRHKIRSQDG